MTGPIKLGMTKCETRMNKKVKSNFSKLIYLIILPVLALLIQAYYTFSSTQIRLEEVIETFRSVYWFDNKLVWNGSYSFLGWYSLLSFVYNNFGFSIYTVKYLKLGIELISFIFLSLMLKKYLGEKIAWIAFFTFVLSPTLLYLNSLQLSLGIEVSFFIICTYLATKLNYRKTKNYAILLPLIWFLAMFAWLTYPGFIFFIPILIFICVYSFILQKIKPDKIFFKYILLSALAFFLPFVILFFYIQNRELLVYDNVMKLGIFRSYSSIELSLPLIKNNLEIFVNDFFIRPQSLYFEVEKVEFSDFYPIFGLFSILLGSLIIVRRKNALRIIIIGALSISLIYFISLLFVGPITINGIRRATVLLIIFYFLYAVSLKYFFEQKKNSLIKFIVLGGCLFIFFHNFGVFPINFKALSKESQFREKWYFNTDRPDLIHEEILKKLQTQDIVLVCYESLRKDVVCPGLSLIYPAIAGACSWNNLACKNILLYNPKNNKVSNLDINFWGRKSHTDP